MVQSRKRKKYKAAEDALFDYYGVKRVEHRIPIYPLKCSVRVQIAGEGDPIVFIHGGPNAGSTWAELVSYLREYQCILIDRPGCGLSEVPNGRKLSRVVLLDWILSTIDGVLEHFQLERVNLVGSSFGGYWVLQYALRRPERVQRMILEGCPAMVEGMKVPDFMKALTRPVLRWLIPRLPTSRSYSRKIFQEIGHTYAIEQGKVADAFIAWYVHLMNDTDTLKNDSRVIHELVPGGSLNPQYVLPDREIRKLTMPTLWLWGEDDPFGGVDVGKRIHSGMMTSEFVSFKNSGHLPWLDEPRSHAEHIAAFVA